MKLRNLGVGMIAAMLVLFGASVRADAATVTTDKSAYGAGQVARIAGSGWSAGEIVELAVGQSPELHSADTLYILADDSGNVDSGYVVPGNGVPQSFALTASGQTSGSSAQATFTNAEDFATVTLSPVATVPLTTNKDQYAPGETVLISGSGWAPRETVALQLADAPPIHPSHSLSAIADDHGRIFAGYFVTNDDIDRMLTLTATGASSGLTAQVVFADDKPPECASNADCNDSNPCTNDSCNTSNGQCQHDSSHTNGNSCSNGNVCDGDEVCQGGTCRVGTDAAAGTSCGSSDSNDCNAPDTCNGSGVCVDRFKPAGVTCRGASGQCDVAETCSGSSAACPADGYASTSKSCTGSSQGGQCDNDAADHCGGTSNACVDAFQGATVTCRESAGQCDAAETCSGSSGACPADGFATVSVSCSGTSQGGPCDNDAGDHCTGTSNTCADAFKGSSVTCRPSDGQCDVAETCTGDSGACPADAFAVGTKTCSGASQGGSCDDDAADHCTGTSNTCVDTFKAAGFTCRGSAGQCDVAETCSGSSGACPDDGFASASKSCTGSSQGDVCDNDAADHCLGTANSCIDVFKAASVTCRDSAGQCDVAETCTGNSGACPGDAFATASTSCTGSSQGGVCDNDPADHCTGTSNSCVDLFKPAGFTCRGSAGQCDVAETCSGGSGACPADGFASSSTSCEGSSHGDRCDNDGADHCSGGDNSCVDAFQTAAFTCRDSAGQCDVAETCTGGSGACPADGFATGSTGCTGESQGGQCDNDAADHCSGSENACVDVFASSATSCAGTSQGGDCNDDTADHCTGTDDSCVDVFKPAGTSCGDSASECLAQDTCNGSGSCDDSGTLCSITNFLAPVDNKSTFERKKNSSLPFKFRVFRNSDQQPVTDATAFALLSELAIYVDPVQCDDTSSPIETIPTSESTNSQGLTYDAGADQFLYVWSTKARNPGCYNSQVRLDISDNGDDISNSVSQIRLR